jgi:hypothetical protein
LNIVVEEALIEDRDEEIKKQIVSGVGSTRSILHYGVEESNANLFVASQILSIVDKTLSSNSPQGTQMLKVYISLSNLAYQQLKS